MSKYKALWQGSLVRIGEYLLDIGVMILSLLVSIQLHHFISGGYILRWDQIIGLHWYFYSGFAAIYAIATAVMFKLYNTSLINNSYKNAIQNVFIAIFFMNIPLFFYAFFDSNFFFSTPWFVLVVIVIEMVIYSLYKYIFYRILSKYDKQEILIVGGRLEAEELARKFLLTKDRSKNIKYLYYIDQDKLVDESIYSLIDDVDKIYIAANVNPISTEFILDYATLINYKDVLIVPRKADILLLNSNYDTVDDTMVLHSKNMHLSIEMRFIKRTIDLIVSVILLIVFFIPMLFVALIIKLQDWGPVFYKQERFKRNHEPFYILKFRSMTHKQTKAQEQTLATHNDPRITKFGRFIRATRLDELPQLINVLKGEMTLVGPRPFMKSVVDDATDKNPDFRYRSNVKPGITGLSHVYGRYDTSAEERLRYDLLYVRQCNLWLDFKIMFLTIIIIFNKEAGLGRERELPLEELMKDKSKQLIKLDSFSHNLYKVIEEISRDTKKGK